MNMFVALLLLYILVGTIIAYFSRKMGIKDARDYIIAGGRVGSLVSFGTYAATTYSAFMMLGLVGLAYSTGVGALGFELLYLLVTVIILSTIGFKIWRLSREKGWITPSQMLGDIYSSRLLGILVAGLYLFTMIPYVAAQIQGLTIVFTYAGLDPVAGTLVSAAVAYLWILFAGMWSIATTDLYQAILMLTGGLLYITQLMLPAPWLPGASPSQAIALVGEKGYLGLTDFWTPHVFLAYTVPWIFFALTNPQVVMRLYIQRDEAAYRRSVALFSFYGLLYTLIAVTAGLLARGFAEAGFIPANLKRDEVTIYLIRLFNPFVGSLIAVSIVAAAVSTVNSIVHAVASSIYREVIGSPRRQLALLNAVSLVIIALSSFLAYARVAYIVDLSVMTSVYLLPLAPITAIGLYLARHVGSHARTAALLSLATGETVAVASTLLNRGSRAFTSVYAGVPASLWVLTVSTLVLLAGFMLDIYVSRRESR